MTTSTSGARPRALALAIACAFTPPALAQGLPTVEITGAAPRAGLPRLDTPIETGSRLGLTSRETPASVNVVDRATIELRGAQDTQEILRALPGVTAHNAPGNIGVFYRGFGSGSVSQLFNGINVQYSIAARPVDSWIYERVEAIGGPSSFMAGSGAVGGTINTITKLAQDRESGEARLRVGADGLREGSFGLNRQVADGHYARIELNHRDSDNWIEGTGSRATQLAASLRSRLAPSLTHTLAYEYQEEDVDRPYWGTPLLNPVAGRARISEATRFKNYNSLDSVYDQRVHWLRSVSEYRPDEATRWTDTFYVYDALRDYRNVETYRFNPENTAVIRSGVLLQRHDQRLVGNRLDGSHRASLFGRRSDWAYGLDVSLNRQTRFPNSLSTTVGAVDPYRSTLEHFFDIPGMTPSFRPDRDNRVRTTAAYLENRTALLPTLHLVTALRHERIELDLTNRREVTAANPASFTRRYRPTTGRAGLVWDLSPNAMLYAQYATAADPPSGVLSTASFADVRNNSELTRGRQGEIGAKLDFWDGKGSATLAAFDISRRNIATQDPDNSALTVLVGEQTGRGMELALGLQPTRQWSIRGDLSKVEARYANFRQGGVSLAGKTPTNTPETVANLWLGWEPMAGVKASVGLRHVGRIYADAANTVHWPAYTLADLALSVKLRPDLVLTGRIRNVGDRIYAANMAATMAYLGAPRSAEVALHYTFRGAP